MANYNAFTPLFVLALTSSSIFSSIGTAWADSVGNTFENNVLPFKVDYNPIKNNIHRG